MAEDSSPLRILEALLFASDAPMSAREIAAALPNLGDVEELLLELEAFYSGRGVTLRRVGEGWAFRTAPDVAPHLNLERRTYRELSQAALETLAIIAYHQPTTRAEIEDIRGRTVSGGTLEILVATGWVTPKGRRRSVGKPVTWGTTQAFLDHFHLPSLDNLPSLAELKAAGFFEAAVHSRHNDAEGEREDDEAQDTQDTVNTAALPTDDHATIP